MEEHKIIECIQWDIEERIKKIKDRLGDNLISEEDPDTGGVEYFVKTSNRNIHLRFGDYIVESDGEIRVYDPCIFNGEDYERELIGVVKYRKIPECIEAIRWNSLKNVELIKEMCGNNLTISSGYETYNMHYAVETPEVNKTIHWGDYIVKKEDGTFDVYNSSEFNKIYEQIKD